MFSLFKHKKIRHPLTARLLHWTYAPAILASIFSGFYITRPSRMRGFKNMDSARKTHFITKYIIIFSYLARVYYGFQEKNYQEIIPGRKDIMGMSKILKYEMFLTDKKPKFPKYNPLHKMVYTGFALLIPVQIISGLALYATNTFQKPASLAGGLNQLRKLHYLVSIAVSSLAAGHIYFVFIDSLKKLKSIFTGYK